MFDLTTVPGLRAAERLRAEVVAWLTTVSPAGQPQTSPVWFLFDGHELVIRSLDDSLRERNLRENGRVSFHLDSDGEGGEIVVIEGDAVIDDAGLTPAESDAYRSKYDVKLRAYGWTWDGFERDYPVVIRIAPKRVRLA